MLAIHTYIHTYITLHYITVQYSTVHYSTLQYITLHYIHIYIYICVCVCFFKCVCVKHLLGIDQASGMACFSIMVPGLNESLAFGTYSWQTKVDWQRCSEGCGQFLRAISSIAALRFCVSVNCHPLGDAKCWIDSELKGC